MARAPRSEGEAADWGVLSRHPYASILVLGLLVHAQTLFFRFNFIDDNQLILGRPVFLGALSSIFQAFREDALAAGLRLEVPASRAAE